MTAVVLRHEDVIACLELAPHAHLLISELDKIRISSNANLTAREAH